MAENVKMLRGHVKVVMAYPEAFADPTAPTSAELNNLFVYSTNEDGMVFDISCAIVDDGYTFNLTESEVDDTRTICQIGQVQNPTFQTAEVSFDMLRDLSVTDNGVFNLGFDQLKGVDRPYWAISRIGAAQADPFAPGQDIKMIGVRTDNPLDLVEDNSLVRFGARFKMTGDINWNYKLQA